MSKQTFTVRFQKLRPPRKKQTEERINNHYALINLICPSQITLTCSIQLTRREICYSSSAGCGAQLVGGVFGSPLNNSRNAALQITATHVAANAVNSTGVDVSADKFVGARDSEVAGVVYAVAIAFLPWSKIVGNNGLTFFVAIMRLQSRSWMTP